ncbi:FkbM family methyltransferase [bacterium]|nr:FkbM family methyltransferase [bacterium]
MPDFARLFPVGVAQLLERRRRLSALGLSPSLAFSQPYRRAVAEAHLHLLPQQLLPEIDCVVDVGANVGYWSEAVALLTRARRIVAFEPNPTVFASLAATAQRFPQIRAVNAAAGAQPGRLTLNVYAVHELSSPLAIRDEIRTVHGLNQDAPTQVDVPVVTLDDELADVEQISILKLDVQGYEPQVLAGAKSVLQRTKVLMTEITYASYYHGDTQFGAMHELITATSPLRLWGIGEPHCAPSGQPLWADAVFVTPELAIH